MTVAIEPNATGAWHLELVNYKCPEERLKTGSVERPDDKTFTVRRWVKSGAADVANNLLDLPAEEWEVQVNELVLGGVEEFDGRAIQEDMGVEDSPSPQAEASGLHSRAESQDPMGVAESEEESEEEEVSSSDEDVDESSMDMQS